MTDAKLDPETERLVLEVSKQLVTLSVASIGVVSGLVFTTFKGTPFTTTAQVSLFSFLLCAGSSVLAQLSLVTSRFRDRRIFKINYPRMLLFVSWVFFVSALAAFVMFVRANLSLAT